MSSRIRISLAIADAGAGRFSALHRPQDLLQPGHDPVDVLVGQVQFWQIESAMVCTECDSPLADHTFRETVEQIDAQLAK